MEIKIASAHANSLDEQVAVLHRAMEVYRELRSLSYLRPGKGSVNKYKAAADTLAPLIADMTTNRMNQALLTEHSTHRARELEKQGYITEIGDLARARARAGRRTKGNRR
jgi:hypothetical protein